VWVGTLLDRQMGGHSLRMDASGELKLKKCRGGKGSAHSKKKVRKTGISKLSRSSKEVSYRIWGNYNQSQQLKLDLQTNQIRQSPSAAECRDSLLGYIPTFASPQKFRRVNFDSNVIQLSPYIDHQQQQKTGITVPSCNFQLRMRRRSVHLPSM
jgi:hypothetical protein